MLDLVIETFLISFLFDMRQRLLTDRAAFPQLRCCPSNLDLPRYRQMWRMVYASTNEPA